MENDVHYWRSRALSGDTKGLALAEENVKLRRALEDIADLYDDSLSIAELSQRMYDARCIALTAIK